MKLQYLLLINLFPDLKKSHFIFYSLHEPFHVLNFVFGIPDVFWPPDTKNWLIGQNLDAGND